jgi:integrase
MASLYPRKNSPYWWIRYKDEKGKWKSKATPYRRDNAQDTKIARSRCVANTAEEMAGRIVSNKDTWDTWVEPFFDTHCENPTTRGGYDQSWLWLSSYLQEIEVTTPLQLTYEHAFNFIGWRMARGGNKAKIKKSTALRDLKVLRLLMTHAVQTKKAPFNPCYRMGIKRDKPKEKEEFTDEQIETVYKKLPKREKDWRFVSFRIALETGCRLGETRIAFKDIDLALKIIKFSDKKSKAYPFPLPDSLIPMLKKIKATGAEYTVNLPENASQLFSNFLEDAGLAKHSFHGTRVTFIARLERAGVPLREAMKMVNHSSEAVHKIYSRQNVDDVKPYANKVRYPQPKKEPQPRLRKGKS